MAVTRRMMMLWTKWLVTIACSASALGALACKGGGKTASAEDDPQKPVLGSWDDANTGSDAGTAPAPSLGSDAAVPTPPPDQPAQPTPDQPAQPTPQ